jgi:AcrR family transcriptional regulator
MGRPAALSKERIVSAAVVLAARSGVDQLTVRALGEELGCDPTALYRHFRNVEELHREVGDHFLADVDVAPRPREGWRTAVRRLCRELRQAQLRQPRLAVLVRSAPTRLRNELGITEALLRELGRGGFRPAAAARAYHALIEFTVGSATIDAALASQPVATREATYRAWRSDYAALAADEYPSTAATAVHLYQGSADRRFDDALDALLTGLESRRR